MELMLQLYLIPEAGRIMTPTLGGWGEVDPASKSQQTLPSVLPADPNTLFRSNSLASKAMEQFMKVSTQRPGGAQLQLPQGDSFSVLTGSPELGRPRLAQGSCAGLLVAGAWPRPETPLTPALRHASASL